MRALALLLIAAPVLADPDPKAVKLTLDHAPMPRTLKMRRIAQTPQPTSSTAAKPLHPMPQAPAVSATQPDVIEGLDGLRDVHQPVSFSLNLGYQVDGARANGRAGLGSTAPRDQIDYASLRSYGFGEAFLSTRGLVLDSLESYFDVRFQAARQLKGTTTDPATGAPLTDQIPSPIATWFDRTGTELRTGWAEMHDFLPARFGLQELRVRAGDQFVYGPWVLHLDGLYAAYEGKTLTAAIYSGTRHSDYSRDQSPNRPLAAGATLRFDLRGLTDKVPIVVTGDVMGLTKSSVTGEDNVDTEQIEIDWRPRRDVVVLGAIRGVNGVLANQHVEVRTRYRQVTNFVFDVTRTFDADWRWDPSLVTRPTEDLTEARRYLDLGPVLPQILASARAGTLIAENIDLLARIATATDTTKRGTKVDTFSAPYVEGGGALEVRLRRQAAFGLSFLRRVNTRTIAMADLIVDEHGPIQPLPNSSLIGQEGFTEVGATLKLTLGARKFSAMVEIYGRQTDYANVYVDPISPLPTSDLRGGGRFTVDAWVSRKVRLFASYDVSSALDTAPDINGYKSLRMMVSGIY
jgi:hypothetical protein